MFNEIFPLFYHSSARTFFKTQSKKYSAIHILEFLFQTSTNARGIRICVTEERASTATEASVALVVTDSKSMKTELNVSVS